MKNVFDSTFADELQQRLMRLRPESQPQWGKMSVAQMLAHCRSGIQMAMGVVNPRRASFPANVIGLMIKPIMLADDKPMRRNSPSSPELFVADGTLCDFEGERNQLIATMQHFIAGGYAACSRHPHPFLGSLKPGEWAILMYKHLDHHLRQFSA